MIKLYGDGPEFIQIEGLKDDPSFAVFKETGLDKNQPVYIAFSDGTIFKARYEEQAFWRIKRVDKGEANSALVEKAGNSDDDTDHWNIAGNISSVCVGKSAGDAIKNLIINPKL